MLGVEQINNRRRIADGDWRSALAEQRFKIIAFLDYLQFAPSVSLVARSFADQIDLTGVARYARLTERDQIAVGRFDECVEQRV